MDIFKTFTFKWWQAGVFKLGMLALGIAIGTYWRDVFGAYLLILITVAVVSLRVRHIRVVAAVGKFANRGALYTLPRGAQDCGAPSLAWLETRFKPTITCGLAPATRSEETNRFEKPRHLLDQKGSRNMGSGNRCRTASWPRSRHLTNAPHPP